MKHDTCFSELNSVDAEETDTAADVDFNAGKGILRITLKSIT